MHMTFFRILLTNLQKCLKKILLSPRSETLYLLFMLLVWIYLKAETAFFLGIFRGWSIKYKNNIICIGTSCKITAPLDKFCGNKSKICMTSHNRRFFRRIFPIIQFWRPCGISVCMLLLRS
jgi:hypothetical protein